MLDSMPIKLKGHVKITDNNGNVLVDKDNAVHPQNMARIIARALSNESNSHIYRIAYGNGGTTVDSAYTVTFKSPNDGQAPDTNTWRSRLYNETYSEVIDESSPLLSINPSSSSSSNPSGDGTVGLGVISNELGLTSEVVITSTLNFNEPLGQFNTYGQTSNTANTEGSFVFDEIGLFTTGAPNVNTNAYVEVNVGNKTSVDDTTLLANTAYSFKINVNGGGDTLITFTTPASGGSGVSGEILYGDLCQAINTGNVAWNPAWAGSSPLPLGSKIAINDDTTSFTTISGSQTFGMLKFTSGTTGSSASITVSAGTSGLNLFSSLNSPTGATILAGYAGKDAGVQNNTLLPSTEMERMLSHIIFQPVFKSANVALTVTYTLTISVARSI